MNYQVGEVVVHWSYGPGEIVQLDEKEMSGQVTEYYVVKVRDMTLWVPRSSSGSPSLRRLTPPQEFEQLFTILQSPGEPLSVDRLERKTQLMDLMKDGKLESICKVIRDLALFSKTKKMNESDTAIMERAKNFLLTEWKLSLAVPLPVAQEKLKLLLQEQAGG